MLKTLSLPGFWPSTFSKTKVSAVNKAAGGRWRFYFAAALIAANALALMSYIYGVNAFASKGYEIQALQKRAKSLEEDSQKLNLKISEASSMVNIKNDFLSSNFVSAGTAKFLEVNSSQFTQR